jgi:restriction endonuclease S subunit
MANKVTTVQSSEIESQGRLESKLYIFQSTLNKAKQKFKFVTLGSISTEITRGQSPKPETYKDKFNGKKIFLRTADVKKYQFSTQTAVYLSDDIFAAQKKNRVKANDILISVVGNYLGSTAVIPENITEGAFNDNSARIRITDESVSPFLVSYFLNSKFGQKLIHSQVTRTGQKILSAGNVKKLEVPIITDNKIIELAKRVSTCDIKSNELITQAQNLFYQKLDIDFSTIKKQKFFSTNLSDFAKADLWIPMYSYPQYVNTLKEVQKKFQTVSLGKIASVKKGDETGSDNYIGYLDKRENDIPFVRTSDIVNYETDQYPDFYIPEEIYNELGQDISAGEILFTKDGKIGMAGMITKSDKTIVASGLARIKLKLDAKQYYITPEFLFLVLSLEEFGIYGSKRRTVVASTIPYLREERLKEIEIPILDKTSIDEITELVKQAFELKAERKLLIKKCREIIDNYFE